MDQAATLNGRKRSVDDASVDVENETPASSKRQKLDSPHDKASNSTPNALKAVASAISGVFGYTNGSNRQPEKINGSAQSAHVGNASPSAHPLASNPPKLPAVSTSSSAKPRPSIKLAALQGTIWDNGNLPQGKKGKVAKVSAKSVASSPSAKGIGKATLTGPLNGKSQTPKGILTPKKKRGRPRKNVTFNRGLDGEVYFEDLPKTPSSRKSKAPQPPKTETIVCEICSKPDSNAPNEIILCDNCDFAVHQQCYDVEEIPEGEWLCKSCMQEDVLKTPVKAKGPPTLAPEVPKIVDVPDIPNLDQHLQSFQRILLDRCSGHRRIKIFGQEEAYDKAAQLVEQTVVAGESNSMLIIGPRGCGKTTVWPVTLRRDSIQF